MRTRTLGKSGLVVSELTLGTLSLAGELYGPVEPAEADRTIARARELGVTLFETADVYGATGESMEARLGRVLERDDQAYLVTKGGNDAQNSRKRFDRMFLHRSAARSADRLRRKPDVYLLHHPSVDTLRRGEAVGTLEELMRDGVIAKWGVACGEAAVAEVAIELGAPVIELPYNLFHQDDLNEVASKAVANNVGVLARSPLAYGLLCGTWPADKVFADGDHRRDRWNRSNAPSATLPSVAAPIAATIIKKSISKRPISTLATASLIVKKAPLASAMKNKTKDRFGDAPSTSLRWPRPTRAPQPRLAASSRPGAWSCAWPCP